MTSYPISIQAETIDMSKMIETSGMSENKNKKSGIVNHRSCSNYLLNCYGYTNCV